MDAGRRLRCWSLEDPTAGVDVGAKAEIYRLLAEAAPGGKAVLLISTDFEEVAAICHRALVFRDGVIVAELEADELSVEALMRATSLRKSEHADARRTPQAGRHDAVAEVDRTRTDRGRACIPADAAADHAAAARSTACRSSRSLLIAVFSFILPEHFPTMLNLRSILGDKAIIAILSLAAMIPMMAGRIDLTVGYGIVLWHILAIALQTKYGIDWRIAVLLVLVLGCLLGLFNGLLVEIARIDSFIATLGTGTVIYAIALWYTEGRQIIGVLPRGFTELYIWQPFGIPVAAFYVLSISLVLWIVAEYLPIGRYLYAIGANPRAAALNGIPTRRYVIGAFIASGFLSAVAGVILAAKLRIGQASVGLEFLLPALVGAFLGSTTIKPGRVNVWGTIVGVAILAVGISGIQQLGGAFYIEPLFNGRDAAAGDRHCGLCPETAWTGTPCRS